MRFGLLGKRFLSEGRALQSSLLRAVKPPRSPSSTGGASGNGFHEQKKKRVYEHPVHSNKERPERSMNQNHRETNTEAPRPSETDVSSKYEPHFVQFSPIIKGDHPIAIFLSS
jgi:hypothetical protein